MTAAEWNGGSAVPETVRQVRPSSVPGSIHGQVVDHKGGVAEATVVVLRGPGPVPDIAAVTDGDGWFVFDGLPAGSYRLRAVGPDGDQGEADLLVPGTEPAPLVIRLNERT